MNNRLIFYLFACVFAMMFFSCTVQNSPEKPTEEPTEEPTYEYDTYIEPSMNWGAQSMVVQNEMTSNGFVMTSEVFNGGYLLKNYAPRKKEEMTVQFFDQNSLQYLSTQVFVKYRNYSSWTELCNFLSERHTFVYNTADTKIWISKDKKTFIELSTANNDGTSYNVVTYSPKQ